MYSYNDLLKILKVTETEENKKYVKSIVNSLVKSRKASIEKQLINLNIDNLEYLWQLFNKLNSFFDYRYNTKMDLTAFFNFIINNKQLNFNAIFCPGYTDNGYKNYIGSNNSARLETLYKLKEFFKSINISTNFNIAFSDIFLENTNSTINPNWQKELEIHKKEFLEKSMNYFSLNEIKFLSSVFSEKDYIKGFVDKQIIKDNNYIKFYKNNLDFYHKMGWNDQEIMIRNDKLYTIYNIISQYINEQENSIYLPMETMYSRSKIMTSNGICTMYFYK